MNLFLSAWFSISAAFVPERIGDALPAFLLFLFPVLAGLRAFLRTARKSWLLPPAALVLLGAGTIAMNLASASYNGPNPGMFDLILPAMLLWPVLAVAFTATALIRGKRKPPAA